MAKLINETGNTYGYLTVIKRADNDSSGRARWLCRCKCGNEVIVLGKHLRSGNTKSCGCYQKEQAIKSNMNRANNLVGQKFGKLLVLSECGFIEHSSGKRSRIYNCLCDCGNYCQIQHQYLEYGDTTSCGCIRSKGEFQIEQILKEKNIEYKREFHFEDLKDKDYLHFDFAIFENDKLKCLIEYQGEQHYNKNNGYYNEDIIRHDKQKYEYCISKKIPLIIIQYKRNYNLKYEDLQLEEYIDELWS